MITDHQALCEWKALAAQQAPGRTVLDLEADSLHRYHEKLCLIQYGDANIVKLIDPLAIEDMRPFSTWITETEIWMHGSDYDMCLFQQAFGVLPKMIFDTQIAARLLGFRHFGLAALVEYHFGVVLSKKNQKADWGKRPMSEDMIEYAQCDVKYMLPMADMLVAKLHERGRYEWFLESCAYHLEKGRNRRKESNPDAWRIKGSGKLIRRGLGALRALWNWRDKEASEWDRPPFMVCSNDDLIRWSLALQEFRTASPRRNFHAQRAARFHKAVDRFLATDEDDYPQRPPRIRHEVDEQYEDRLESWIALRNKICAELELDPSILGSRIQLESVAMDEEKGLAAMMNWQRELFSAARQG